MEMEETAKTDIESERQCVCVWLWSEQCDRIWRNFARHFAGWR